MGHLVGTLVLVSQLRKEEEDMVLWFTVVCFHSFILFFLKKNWFLVHLLKCREGAGQPRFLQMMEKNFVIWQEERMTPDPNWDIILFVVEGCIQYLLHDAAAFRDFGQNWGWVSMNENGFFGCCSKIEGKEDSSKSKQIRISHSFNGWQFQPLTLFKAA